MKKLTITGMIILLIQFYGCIRFNNVSYEVVMNGNGQGTATVLIRDINTDATSNEAKDEDVKSILEHGWKSQEFIDDMISEGKKIISRDVYVEDEKLNAKISYEFDDINRVEGMQYEDPYYYLTIPVDDSIISTNGQVTRTAEYQRIVWDKTIKILKFTMFSDNTDSEGLTSLAKYFKKED